MCDPRAVVRAFEEQLVDALKRRAFVESADGLWCDPSGEVAVAVHVGAGAFVGLLDTAWPHPATPVTWQRDVLHLPWHEGAQEQLDDALTIARGDRHRQ